MAALLPKCDSPGTYTFSSRPRAVHQRKKYRDPYQEESQSQITYGNIMYDRRIVRGNTYAQNVLPTTAQPDPIEIQKQKELRRKALAQKRAKQLFKPQTPEPVEGRKHIDVQTELYLEELTDRVEEADIFTQTDPFLDRPPSPLYIPAKTGVDVATQILEGDLFHFDIEVKPILEVLVGKTIEQSLLEVMEEEELANLRVQQRKFEELRNAELVETQRLEEQERRHREEKERRMRQQREVLKKEKETTEKIAARAFAQSYLQDLVPSVFGTLHEHGYFYDPVERDVESDFMPWLLDRVLVNLDKVRFARTVLDNLIRDSVSGRMSIYNKLDEAVEKKIRSTIEAVTQTMKAPSGPDFSKNLENESAEKNTEQMNEAQLPDPEEDKLELTQSAEDQEKHSDKQDEELAADQAETQPTQQDNTSTNNEIYQEIEEVEEEDDF